MKRKIIISLITFILQSNYSYSQNEYGFLKGQIVKKENDTLNCFVEMSPSYGSVIKYKIKSDSPELKLNVNQIKFLMTPYNKFENITYNNHERLMTIVSSGKAILYNYIYFDDGTITNQDVNGTITTYRQSTTYILKKENDLYEVRHGNFKELLTTQLSDCKGLVSKIVSKKYKFKDIEKVIEEYNKCIE